jgi:hypothetical protein
MQVSSEIWLLNLLFKNLDLISSLCLPSLQLSSKSQPDSDFDYRTTNGELFENPNYY